MCTLYINFPILIIFKNLLSHMFSFFDFQKELDLKIHVLILKEKIKY